MTDKALEAAAREIAANHWSVDSNMGKQAYQDAHWLFHADDAEAAISAYLSALPGEAEVVAWAYPQGEKVGVTTNRQTACDAFPGIATPTPLVTLASLQAMQARAEAAEARVKVLEEALEHVTELFVDTTTVVDPENERAVIAARTALKGGSNG